jgi:hypothetical protein
MQMQNINPPVRRIAGLMPCLLLLHYGNSMDALSLLSSAKTNTHHYTIVIIIIKGKGGRGRAFCLFSRISQQMLTCFLLPYHPTQENKK